jgi:hypothetical protein
VVRRNLLIGLVLLDLPFLLLAASLGLVYGFQDVTTGYLDWREQHAWTYLLTLPLIAAILIRRRRRR